MQKTKKEVYDDITESVLKQYTPSERSEIEKAFDKLYRLILEEVKYGRAFKQIINSPQIKYDIYKSDFYGFKSRGKDKSQIRLLYRYIEDENGTFHLELHKAYIKRRSGKTYLHDFENYVNNYIN